ncbi:MAG TPA: sigma-54 dependent transcriptional regulator, partial [Candidatus Limnocylindrales bacterium]|nr:sigma-54 dependent transcriptional regulator [Candidatus Limnocylindrales bacterium]
VMSDHAGEDKGPIKALRVLVVEDEPDLRDVVVNRLARLGTAVQAAPDGIAGGELLRKHEFDIVLLDLRMPRMSGIEFLRALRADGHDAEVIVMTAHAEVDTAVEALRLQAFDYLTKPFRARDLERVVGRAIEHRQLRRENRLLRRAVSQHEGEPVVHGQSAALERLRGLLHRAGRSQSHVLIVGESGSGKELAARTIHRESARRDLPFLAINCATLPDELLESELFGHEKGAFTGAATRRHGLLELAHEGTLFLDEVAEMSLLMQAKLLRAIDLGEIRRLGGDRTHYVDVRVIAATNKDVGQAVASGQFCHDLYYRLGGVVVEVPPLRERVEDIPLLVELFARQVALPGQPSLKITADAMAVLVRYPWPGNVRELRNIVEQLTVLSSGQEVSAAEVALHLPGPMADRGDAAEAAMPLDEVERRHILRVLRQTGGNRAQTAKFLGVDPKTLYNKLKLYERSAPGG